MNEDDLLEIENAIAETGLPVTAGCLRAAAQASIKYFDLLYDLRVDEVADRIREIWKYWLIKKSVNVELRGFARAVLNSSERTTFIADGVFELYDKLVECDYLEHEQAMAVIASSDFIVSLASQETMSAYSIVNHLGIPGVAFNSVQHVLRAGDSVPSISREDVNDITERDKLSAIRVFKDDSLEQSYRTLAAAFESSGFFSKIVEDVRYLDSEVSHEPYLGILHYELITLAKYDRFPGRAVYEFAPRGDACNALWKHEYNGETQNPYLNNVKGFLSIDDSWASNRGGGAMKNGPARLVRIFDALNKLPRVTRQHAGELLRQWLCWRLICKNSQKATQLSVPSLSERSRFVESVCRANTKTCGIFEQRVCDLLSMLDQPEDMRIHARGLGSSVNESNYSAAKFGDIEFADYGACAIVGYEAHGGQLRDEYIDLHLNSLYRILENKRPELKEQAEPDEWDMTIIYVAHDLSRLERYSSERECLIMGYTIKVVTLTFYELAERVGGIDLVASCGSLFEELVHDRLNYGSLPEKYSKRYQEILGV